MYMKLLIIPEHISEEDIDAYFNTEMTKLKTIHNTSVPQPDDRFIQKIEVINERRYLLFFHPQRKNYGFRKEFNNAPIQLPPPDMAGYGLDVPREIKRGVEPEAKTVSKGSKEMAGPKSTKGKKKGNSLA
jgi:hypothetical protein